MLYNFLLMNKNEILAMTEKKALDLGGTRSTSDLLKSGLPIFYGQLLEVLRLEQEVGKALNPPADKAGMAKAARENNEPAMAVAAGRPDEACVAKTAGIHGVELQRLGYTLSHVVHAYGAMCQAITELATTQKTRITTEEFHDLNRCLDVAIAGAVTEYQSITNTQDIRREVEHLGFLAHELRNSLNSVNISFQIIKTGTVGLEGTTGQMLERGLKRIEDLIDRSLTEVRLRVDPKVHLEASHLLSLVDQIMVTAHVVARSKNQTLEIQIDPTLFVDVDQQLFYSALSNLVQNALKFSHDGGKIQVRGRLVGENIVVEVEDECGGLPPHSVLTDLFKPFEQQNKDRNGLGLGLSIAQRAISLNRGTIEVSDLPGKGCVFKIILPQTTLPKNKNSSFAKSADLAL